MVIGIKSCLRVSDSKSETLGFCDDVEVNDVGCGDVKKNDVGAEALPMPLSCKRGVDVVSSSFEWLQKLR